MRRQVLKGAAVLAAAAFMPGMAFAQTRTTALPSRGELLIRGATVLTMDPGVPDLAAGDVHVRDGVIVAVAGKSKRRGRRSSTAPG